MQSDEQAGCSWVTCNPSYYIFVFGRIFFLLLFPPENMNDGVTGKE